MKKIKDILNADDIGEYRLNKKYYLFLEKCVDYILVELHEITGKNNKGEYYTDFVETLNNDWTIDTPLRKLTFRKVKKLATYKL